MTTAEAKSRAVEIYKKYLHLKAQEGASETPSPALTVLLTPDALAEERKGSAELLKRGVHTAGAAILKQTRVQRWDESVGELSMYGCLDFSRVRVLNSAGADVTPKGRLDLQTALLTFKQRDGQMLFSGDEEWSGPSIC